MRKTLKVLIAVVCVLLALAIALLIYLEIGKTDGNDPSATQPTEVSSATDASTATEAEGTTGTEGTEGTEEAPLETREGGVPNYNWDEDETEPTGETTPETTPGETDVPDETEPYVPDEDELPQMPI